MAWIALAGLLLNAFGRIAWADPVAALALSRPSSKRPLTVLVSPVSRLSSFLDLQPAAILFVSDPERAEEADADLIQRLYNLTPAEANVTMNLIAGKNVQESADALAVEPNTVRIHLKKVFEKISARRQAELVRMVMQSPALVRKKNSRHTHLGNDRRFQAIKNSEVVFQSNTER